MSKKRRTAGLSLTTEPAQGQSVGDITIMKPISPICDVNKPWTNDTSSSDDSRTVFCIGLIWMYAIHQAVRRHLHTQVASSIKYLSIFQRIRHPIATKFFELASVCGSEDFYVALIPCVLWNTNSNCDIGPQFLMLFAWGQVTGDWMKNLYCLPRPPPEYLLHSMSKTALDNRDFGWPSTHSINACTLPFFLLRAQFGFVWWWSSDQPFTMFLWWSVGFLWLLSITTSRLYLGVHCPADIFGGLLTGAICLRTWLWICDDLLSWIRYGWFVPLWATMFIVGLLLFFPRPLPATYTIVECCSLLGFEHGFAISLWLSSGHITTTSVNMLTLPRMVIGFGLFVIMRKICKVCGKSALRALEWDNPPPSDPKESKCDESNAELAWRFIMHSYLGWFVAYVIPLLFTSLNMW